jgi:hypothetical protein
MSCSALHACLEEGGSFFSRMRSLRTGILILDLFVRKDIGTVTVMSVRVSRNMANWAVPVTSAGVTACDEVWKLRKRYKHYENSWGRSPVVRTTK